MDAFATLSDEAHVWVYAADRTLTGAEQEAVRAALDAFCAGWTSHRRPVRGAADVLFDRFAVVAGEIPGGDLSGCGIDASVHAVDEVARAHGFGWLPSLFVLYRDAGGVQGVPRATFRRLVAEGRVTAETPVFDLSVASLGALRRGGLERPAGESWHARVFRIPATAA